MSSFSAISITNSSFSIAAITYNDKYDYQEIEIFSILCGYVSVICWIFALYPQIIANFRQKSAKALSLALLTNWAIGDAANLIGSLFDENNKKLIGIVMGYMCAFLYVTGRLPQIYRNYKRKSVKGLSMTMFILIVLGNITYSLSIFTNPLVFFDLTFIRSEIPYFISSLGTLTFDTVIFLQWKYYSVRRGIYDEEGLEIIV
ncbi:7678_t:CDS:2 [Diversispora eburnea]|uniref:7678_t:CDS:1 n=1 Tax=Diversispora eburnea TaxID=1213867 RepID=A0A9N8WDR7_9GLOM|nr:7678_t:CDS:2 [Diversispora eburnea]